MSSLLHSFMLLGKNFKRYSILQLKNMIFMVFIVSLKRVTGAIKSKLFWWFSLKGFWKRHSLRIHRLSLRHSGASSLLTFSSDNLLTAPVTARVALCWINSRVYMNFSLKDVSWMASQQPRWGLKNAFLNEIRGFLGKEYLIFFNKGIPIFTMVNFF